MEKCSNKNCEFNSRKLGNKKFDNNCSRYDSSYIYRVCNKTLVDWCPSFISEEEKSSLASDKQVGGSHYKQWKIQPFEFFQKNNVPFHKADIIKRILRYDLPTGKGKEDLEKIKHEIDLIMEFDEEDK